jgi:hypothetical protein
MPCVGFEPTTPAFEREKTFYTFDRVAAVIGNFLSVGVIKNSQFKV